MKTNNSATPAPAAVTVKPVSILLKGFLAIFVFLALMGSVGSMEYNDNRYYSIPDAAFEVIILKLGDDASQQEIISEYQGDKAYYDTL